MPKTKIFVSYDFRSTTRLSTTFSFNKRTDLIAVRDR